MKSNIFRNRQKQQDEAVEKRLRELGLQPTEVTLKGPKQSKARNSLKNRWRKYNKNIKAVVLFLISIFVIIIFAYVLNKTGITKIKDISIVEYSGAEFTNIDPNDLELQLQKTYLGDGYFETRASDVEETAMDLSAYIKDIYVEKLFPSTLKISIIERSPVITLKNTSGCYVFDQERYVTEVLESSTVNTPTMDTSTVNTIEGGEDISDTVCKANSQSLSTIYIRAMDFISNPALRSEIPFYDLENIIITKDILSEYGYLIEDITLEDDVYIFNLEDGSKVLLSRLEDIKIQDKRLIIVLNEVTSQAISFTEVDVRYERPIIKSL